MTTLEERVARMEGIVEEIRLELRSLDQRMGQLHTLLISMWVTVILSILATLMTIIFKG